MKTTAYKIFACKTDGDAGGMSREEMLFHVVTHGGYHRAARRKVA